MLTYENPIIPGFYPDPSICRVGDDYYLVNSSFEFFPGVPLWHSKDLLQWEQLGYVLNRKSQNDLTGCKTSGGIFAPTIRYHQGKYYMITTNVTGIGNFLVWTEDIQSGNWSEPVLIDQQGIDPSLFWDDDGTAYYTGTGSDAEGGGIVQFALNTETGEILSEKKIIWRGTGGKCPEGPHMYKRNGWYYLMIAEGGTEYGHMETIARSRNIWGPFESCPHNPILTHRNCNRETIFHATGHADFVETPDGKWWIVFHAIRPSIFMLHHIGRETMIAPMEWDENDWPVVNAGKIMLGAQMTAEGEGDFKVEKSWHETFSTAPLSHRWAYLRNPEEANYVCTEQGLALHGTSVTLDDQASPTFVGVRQQQFDLQYQTTVSLTGVGAAGITIFHTKDHHYDLMAQRTADGVSVWLRKRVQDICVESDVVQLPAADEILLRIESDRSLYVFYAGTQEDAMQQVGSGMSILLSTEGMNCTFTGCFAGLFAEGDVTAVYKDFRVQHKDKSE